VTDIDLRYPIGKVTFKDGGIMSTDDWKAWIAAIAETPANLRKAVAGLDDAQLDTPYRPGGWTVRQVVHHLPESHMNAFIRIKWTMTEDNPTIKGYDEAAWAELPDTKLPIAMSLDLLEAVHVRFVALLNALGDADFARTYFHPESQRQFTLDQLLQIYAWHGRHHVAHITSLRERKGW
jgi:hypothetical protein